METKETCCVCGNKGYQLEPGFCGYCMHGGKTVEVDIRFNAAGVLTQCALCLSSFTANIGMIPLLHDTRGTVCNECRGSYQFKILLFDGPIRKEKSKLLTCWRCGKHIFEKAYELCFPCNTDLEEEFYTGLIPRD